MQESNADKVAILLNTKRMLNKALANKVKEDELCVTIHDEECTTFFMRPSTVYDSVTKELEYINRMLKSLGVKELS